MAINWCLLFYGLIKPGSENGETILVTLCQEGWDVNSLYNVDKDVNPPSHYEE